MYVVIEARMVLIIPIYTPFLISTLEPVRAFVHLDLPSCVLHILRYMTPPHDRCFFRTPRDARPLLTTQVKYSIVPRKAIPFLFLA